MPTVTYENKRYAYATEQELLDFANKVRAAGGGNPIEAFFPSNPADPSSCLIANALNFNCEVDVGEKDTYHMVLSGPPAEVDKRVRAIAKATDSKIIEDPFLDPEHAAVGIILPARIGNAALAFDEAQRGWVTKYRKDPDG